MCGPMARSMSGSLLMAGAADLASWLLTTASCTKENGEMEKMRVYIISMCADMEGHSRRKSHSSQRWGKDSERQGGTRRDKERGRKNGTGWDGMGWDGME